MDEASLRSEGDFLFPQTISTVEAAQSKRVSSRWGTHPVAAVLQVRQPDWHCE
jgi:hypothetical protein